MTTTIAHVSRYDLVVVEAARAGDRAAIITLLTQAQPDIRRYARRSCAMADDVEDVVQETLWLLYRRVGTLRFASSLSGWLVAVVRRECWRAAQRLTGRTTEMTDAVAATAVEERLARLPLDDLRIDISRAIQSLPPHYREIVLLRDVEEMTIQAIADALSLSREAVKGRLHRGRRLLREYLQD